MTRSLGPNRNAARMCRSGSYPMRPKPRTRWDGTRSGFAGRSIPGEREGLRTQISVSARPTDSGTSWPALARPRAHSRSGAKMVLCAIPSRCSSSSPDRRRSRSGPPAGARQSAIETLDPHGHLCPDSDDERHHAVDHVLSAVTMAGFPEWRSASIRRSRIDGADRRSPPHSNALTDAAKPNNLWRGGHLRR